MTGRLATQLKLKPQQRELLSVSTFAAKTPKDVDTYVANFNLITKDQSVLQLSANWINKITGPIQRGPLQPSDLESLLISPEIMADPVPSTSEPSNVDLLIGFDYFWSILETEKLILPSGLYLISSKIGYILTRKYSDPDHASCKSHISTCFVMTQVNHTLSEVSLFSSSDDTITKSPNIEDFWRLETIGIGDSLDQTDDDRALEQFNISVCFENGRYYINWPWKYESFDLPENLDIAIGRIKSLARRFKRDKSLLMEYDEVISSQITQGIIDKVTINTETTERRHYLPHHPVMTPSKSTTKLQIVYDASIKAKISMNIFIRGVSRSEILTRALGGPLGPPSLGGLGACPPRKF